MIGLIISLGIVLLAFEWKTSTTDAIIVEEVKWDAPEVELPEVVREEKKEEAPPIHEVVEFEIVEDDTEIDIELEIVDTEIELGEAIDYTDYLKKDDDREEVVEATWFPEQQPEFPGGMKALLKFINNSVKYPVVAQESAIQGKVIITFVIDAKGEVTDVKVMRGVDPALDAEALRVVKSLPTWQPGMQAGRAVPVHFNVPINFVLQ